MSDGIIIISESLERRDPVQDLPDLIQDFNSDLQWESKTSESPRSQLWSVGVVVGASQGDISTVVDVPLGIPWASFLRWFALVRIWTPWLAPRHGKDRLELDRDAILLSFLSPQGKHMVLLGISGLGNLVTVFRSDQRGAVSIRVRSDEEVPSSATVLVATSEDFECALGAVMYHARSMIVLNKQMTSEYEQEVSALKSEVNPEWYENWYDGLGFCTWNALGQRLTEEKVVRAIDTLAEHNVNITSLIIDDNWQDIDYRGEGQFQYGWNDFEAEPKAFPDGLKSTVSKVRSKHKTIQHVAVWHALLGYWAGISPNGPIAQRYKTTEVIREDAERRHLPLGGKMTVVAKEDVERFYDEFYRFLSSCGIDGVKTDAQFMMDTWTSSRARRDLIHTYLDAWTLASLRHFSIKSISCMSQTPQILFYSQLPPNRPAVLCRNSDDFFPEVPASHPWHVWTNAHNSVFTQYLNVLPDWDMFQTVHDYSGFHAAARCVSGGPIYITDVPGEHNMDLINQMTGVTPRGKTIIFRPSVVGKTIDCYVGYHDDSLLKVGAYHGRSGTGTSIMGVFNVSNRSLTEIIPLSRFPGVEANGIYVIRGQLTGLLTQPVKPSSVASFITVSLGVRGYDIFCAYPVSVFKSMQKGQIYLANLGLTGKMTGCAAILNSTFHAVTEKRMFLDTTLKALGVLGVYISSLPDLTIEDHFLATIQGQPIPPHTVRKANETVVEIDIETAWKEMGLESGWSNEVELKLYFSR
ncbi:hypothetical protein VTK73DRAFT_6535 [Phialemonium thermophilum]|uniref:Alpha-galactosidase n=1 Tax=Phialemonium thermophilum TaxID=223376 RepID=A0ABR3XVB5_9PEZI